MNLNPFKYLVNAGGSYVGYFLWGVSAISSDATIAQIQTLNDYDSWRWWSSWFSILSWYLMWFELGLAAMCVVLLSAAAWEKASIRN